MADLNPRDIRSIMLVGHSGCGKTSLAEALIFAAGAIPRIGKVDDGNSASDYNDDEKERKISINSSLLNLNYNNTKVNILDIPGYSDFMGEALSAVRAAEGAILVINAASGIEIGTDTFFKLLEEVNLPSMIFVNKIDKENTDFAKTIELIRSRYGKKCAAVTYPIGKESAFKDIADLISKEGIDQISGEDKDEATSFSDELKENVAECDDALLEKYLEKGELSIDEIKTSLRKAVIDRKIIPILCGSATKSIGIKKLLDAIVNYMPSILDRPAQESVDAASNQPLKIEPKTTDPFSAFVFKTICDTYVGQINIFKVYSGSLKTDTVFYNVNKSTKEKIGQLFTLQGKDQKPLDSVAAGDIGCLAKLKSTQTQDSISDEKKQVKFKEIVFPEPAISFSIKPKTRSDEDKISQTLQKLTGEDYTFKAIRNAQTKELVISGMGDLHLAIMINRLKNRFGVQVDVGTPKVAYKETIMSKGESQYRHKKQTGGAGQFAEVWMRIEPLPRSTGFEFVNEVVGGSIPGPFVVSCEKGVKSALESGALAGFPVVDIRVIVYDGKTHPVDSKDIAFQIAARHAFKESFLKARPVILEPIMDVSIIVPDEFMGDVTGSLNSRRGRVMGMEPGTGAQTIKAKVPLAEMYKYVNELKSITQGRATYTMRFSHYEEVPSNLTQVIIAEAKKEKQEEKEE